MSGADLPALLPRQFGNRARRAANVEQRADLELHNHAVRAWTESMKEQIDSAAFGEAIRASTEEEMQTYDEMMALAGDSHVKQQIVLQRMLMMSSIDNNRLRGRFR